MTSRIIHIIFRSLRLAWHIMGVSIIDQFLVSSTTFVISFYLARQLGMSVFGQFSLLLLVVYFCLEVQRSLIIAPMMTFHGHREDEAYLGQLGYVQILFNGILSIAAGFAVFASGWLFPKWQIAPYAVLSAFIIFARLQQEFLRRIFFIKGQARRALVLDIVTLICIGVSVIALTETDRLSLHNVLWWHIAAYLCPSFLAMRHVLHHVPETSHWRSILRNHRRFGKWLAGGTVVQFLSSNWLMMLSGAILGPAATGLVRSAQYMTFGLSMLFQALENIVPVQLARLHHHDPAKVRPYASRVLAGLIGFVALYVLVIYPLLPYCARYLKIDQVALFQLLSMYLIGQYTITATTLIQTYVMRARSLTRPLFLMYCVTALVTLSIGPWLIRTYHEIGVVHGLTLVQIIVSLGLFGIMSRMRVDQPDHV